MIDWAEGVNTDISLEGEYGLDSGYKETIQFESGKEREHLKNSFIPSTFSASLLLTEEEWRIFMKWHEADLRYGTLPFYLKRITGKKPDLTTKTPELGIYKFVDHPKFDRVDGMILATFDLKESGSIPEVQHIFIATEDGEILFTEKKQYIVV